MLREHPDVRLWPLSTAVYRLYREPKLTEFSAICWKICTFDLCKCLPSAISWTSFVKCGAYYSSSICVILCFRRLHFLLFHLPVLVFFHLDEVNSKAKFILFYIHFCTEVMHKFTFKICILFLCFNFI